MHGIEFKHIQPGRPTQNAYIERFNGSYRKGVLNKFIFEDINQVRILTEEWIKDYNQDRPHEGLGGIPPNAYEQEYSIPDSIPLEEENVV